ncbi:DNA-binding transcriptional LysR family regulator [Ciceribacter lividus]|uniref:DNA-binding transcriptional LysR family regulator n=1 Tax=Ciceribacter lividus TaxID=1197950 RepID=A0A6I7HT75_9HYPH|nr:LysR family transcriptional regulator [Ciceribacter lividus]RCW28089.1 DNA-binding transcriptional LysR family regulator [Ciceribacter lividus]
MNWDDYRIFLVLARAGSLSRAADLLKLDHTTVGRRVAALEADLNVRLVHRLPRSIHLTAEGERLAELGSDVEEALARVARVASGAAADVRGLVRISAPPSLTLAVLAPEVTAFRGRHPGIVLSLIGEKTFANLNRLDADIALRLSRPASPGLVVRKLGEMRFSFYAAASYDRPEAEWDFIGYDDGEEPLPQQAWLQARLGGRAFVLRSNDAASQAAAAASGAGVALLPEYVARMHTSLVRLPSRLQTPARELWLVVHEDLRHTPRIRAVLDWLVELVRADPAFGNVSSGSGPAPGA